jgi:hypothetical protein
VLVQFPTTTNILFTAVSFAMAVLRQYLQITQSKLGVVKTTNGELVSNVQLGLFDPAFDTLVYTTFTNLKGEYSFVVENKDYVLKMMDQGYIIDGHSTTPFLIKSSEDDGVAKMLSENIVVKRVVR